MRNARFFGGVELPEIKERDFNGKLFVLEGPDGSGRSTQIQLLQSWLEARGFAVKTMGIKRSNLASSELDRAKQGNILTRTTLSLFYATDFFDQLINEIVPALRAGFTVIADRYIYTLMARDLVRGGDPQWVRNMYSPALVPDAVFYFRISGRKLVERNFEKNGCLDYWESGMDLALSRDMFDSFIKYQRMLQSEFTQMSDQYKFQIVNANRQVEAIQMDLRKAIDELLNH